MTEWEAEPQRSSRPRKGPSASLGRVLAVAVPLVIVAMVGSFLLGAYWQNSARVDLEHDMLRRLLGEQAAAIADGQFADADGDRVADPPAEEDCLSPDTIVFSFIAAEEDRDQATIWKEVMEALSQRLDRPVEYVHFSETDDQLAALKNGELHVTVINTGTVPDAVRGAGFVPVCTFADAQDNYGYTMRIIVPRASVIQEPAQLKGRTVHFTRPNSNSGFKAPLVLLMNEFNLRPERDYQWAFSLGHEESIAGIASGRFDAAPVASDVLERVAARGEVDLDRIRSIYESKRFPPATVGYVYNLTADLCDGIRETLLGFNWEGTGIEEEYGEGGKFVAVSYKDDWDGTREIDETFASLRASLVRTQPPRSATRNAPSVSAADAQQDNAQGNNGGAPATEDAPAEAPAGNE